MSTERWEIVDFEIDMLFNLTDSRSFAYEAMRAPFEQTTGEERLFCYQTVQRVINALVESSVLHARQSCDILLSRGKYADDIKLSDLLKGYSSPKIDDLERYYGRGAGSICEVLNKMCFHASDTRGLSFEYDPIIGQLRTLIRPLWEEICDERVLRHMLPSQVVLPAANPRVVAGS